MIIYLNEFYKKSFWKWLYIELYLNEKNNENIKLIMMKEYILKIKNIEEKVKKYLYSLN